MKFFVTCFKCLSPIVYPKGKVLPCLALPCFTSPFTFHSIVYTFSSLSSFLRFSCITVLLLFLLLLAKCKQVKGLWPVAVGPVFRINASIINCARLN